MAIAHIVWLAAEDIQGEIIYLFLALNTITLNIVSDLKYGK
jgi:hypothetical protein